VQCEHQLGVETLPQRVGRHQAGQLGDQVAVPPERQLGVDVQRQHGVAVFLQPPGLLAQRGDRGEVGVGPAAPHVQRLAEHRGGRVEVTALPSPSGQSQRKPPAPLRELGARAETLQQRQRVRQREHVEADAVRAVPGGQAGQIVAARHHDHARAGQQWPHLLGARRVVQQHQHLPARQQ
jgi:hypothetical protein